MKLVQVGARILPMSMSMSMSTKYLYSANSRRSNLRRYLHF